MSERQSEGKNAIVVADTSWKRALGLMFRKFPRPLLLVFPREARHSIWMLFMRFPIDLIFMDSQLRVVTVFQNIRPISFNPSTWLKYLPTEPAKYALEVEAGWAKKKEIAEGDFLDLGLY